MQDRKFSVATDPVSKIVHATCSGFWSPDEAKDYLGRIIDAIGTARLRKREVRVLVDCRKASVQTLVAMGQISDMMNRAYKPHDRLAIVVESQLLKGQMERLPKVAITRVAVALEDASCWLRSDMPA